MPRFNFRILTLATLLATTAFNGGTYAQNRALAVELNALDTQGANCRISFMAHNKTEEALQGLGYEVVLFNTEGGIDRMTKFDFGGLPAGKTVVRRFDLAGTVCEEIGRVLVNGASRCEAASTLDCDSLLTTTNRTTVEFGK